MLAVNAIWKDNDALPVLNAEDKACAERALATYDAAPRGSTPGRISKFMATLAILYPAAKLTDPEVELRLEAYQIALADIDADVLARAFDAASKTCRFFPSVAEIRECARKVPAPDRMIDACRLRTLLLSQPAVPIERAPSVPLTGEDIRRMSSEVRRLGLKCGALTQGEIDEALDGYEGAIAAE
ncbi:hypothetical protein [Sphingomonas solaris]|uniref:hypothetical protein n=1 Tax=Alterirhizorhabdus solaris TaxID=2529389 RepID=UPI001396A7DC|nr:hypothetical protein [Sphingomonas solaris]